MSETNYTADDYRSWGFKAYEDVDFSTLKNGTFAFRKDKCIALCLEEGNARNKCLTASGALKISTELINFYAQVYRKDFPTSKKGLAFELMYHAYPDIILDALETASIVNKELRIIVSLMESFDFHDHFYWADSYTTDKLRVLDQYVEKYWDIIDLVF